MTTITGYSRAISTAVIPGAAAGVHAVPGDISDGDTIVSVTQLTDATTPVATDRTSEFSIPAGEHGQVENTTTDTTGDFLVVTWVREN